MTRLILAIVAATVLSGCAFFQRDACAREARSDLRAIDAEIAQARADAQSSFAADLSANGDKAPFMCRRNGDAMVECTALPDPARGKLPFGSSAHGPEARLAQLDMERQRILARMMSCQGA